jgi:hypothetical protein
MEREDVRLPRGEAEEDEPVGAGAVLTFRLSENEGRELGTEEEASRDKGLEVEGEGPSSFAVDNVEGGQALPPTCSSPRPSTPSSQRPEAPSPPTLSVPTSSSLPDPSCSLDPTIEAAIHSSSLSLSSSSFFPSTILDSYRYASIWFLPYALRREIGQ